MVAITNKLDWAHALESADGIPSTANTDQTLVDWASAEGGAGPQFGVPNNITDYNPLNVSLTTGPQGYGYDPGTGTYYPGSNPTSGNTPPIAAFSDWGTGIQATADRLKEPFASGILGELRAGAPESQTAAAVAASGWGTGNFAGLNANGSTPAVSGTGTGASGGASATTTSLNWNPLDLFGIPGSVGNSVTAAIMPFLAKFALVLAGIGILIVAAYKAVSPAVGKATQEAAPLAELAA